MKITITGANGFVGRAISNELSKKFKIKKIVRNSHVKRENIFEIGDICSLPDLKEVLVDTDVLIHCIGVSNLKKKNYSLFDLINFDATKNLAEQAVKYNVKRFIYISTFKVYGENCHINKPLSSDTFCKPYSKYGISKLKAEKKLLDISNKTDLEVVIIRCPLIYGGVLKGNLLLLSKLIKLNLPLPLKNINNKRSFLAIDNLVSFIFLCINYQKTPNAKNQIFSISDNEDFSTTELIKKISNFLNKKIVLFRFPKFFFRFLFVLLNKKTTYNSLFDSLYVRCNKANKLLDWQPKTSMENQLNKRNYN